jgi:drug/metabolite transporter (DMT)-like permease
VTWNKGATFSILASFFWGSTYTLFKYPANWMGAIPLAFILESAVVLVAFIWIQITEKEFFKSKMILSNKNIKHYFILASFLLCGNLFFNLAVQKIPILVINIYGFFTLFISISTGLLFYKEKVSLKQAIGILCLLVSIYAVK